MSNQRKLPKKVFVVTICSTSVLFWLTLPHVICLLSDSTKAHVLNGCPVTFGRAAQSPKSAIGVRIEIDFWSRTWAARAHVAGISSGMNANESLSPLKVNFAVCSVTSTVGCRYIRNLCEPNVLTASSMKTNSSMWTIFCLSWISTQLETFGYGHRVWTRLESL